LKLHNCDKRVWIYYYYYCYYCCCCCCRHNLGAVFLWEHSSWIRRI